jgi:hypothetical protein
MKKTFIVILLLIICITSAACGGSQTDRKPTKSVQDLDTLYSFVNNEVYAISREDFDSSIEITYLDVTEDGAEDAILVNNLDWSTNIAVVAPYKDTYQLLNTDILPAKYSNSFELKDGFLAVIQETGGSGVQTKYLTLAVYSEGEIGTILRNLTISNSESHQDVRYEDTSQIKGGYADFQYILTRTEGNNKTILEDSRYKYNQSKLEFEISETTGDSDNSVEKISFNAEKIRGEKVDYGKYDLVVIDSYPGGSLSSLEPYKFVRPGFDGESFDVRDIAIVGAIYNVNYHSSYTGKDYKIADKISNKLLLLTDNGDVSPVSVITFEDNKGHLYSISVKGDEEFETLVVKGENKQIFGLDDGSSNYVVANSSEDFGEDYSELIDFYEETVHGEAIRYLDYTNVVIENYSGNNLDGLFKEEYHTPVYQDADSTYNIAFFGTCTNLTFKSIKLDESYGPYKIADSLTNTFLTFHSNFPTDTSADVIGFYDSMGLYHEIVVDDMSEEYDIIKQ